MAHIFSKRTYSKGCIFKREMGHVSDLQAAAKCFSLGGRQRENHKEGGSSIRGTPVDGNTRPVRDRMGGYAGRYLLVPSKERKTAVFLFF